MSKSKKVVEAVSSVEVESVVEPVVEAVVEAEPTVEFDVWFAMRERRIPPQHLREIIRADFQGQGLSRHATVAVYDQALAKYGVKL